MRAIHLALTVALTAGLPLDAQTRDSPYAGTFYIGLSSPDIQGAGIARLVGIAVRFMPGRSISLEASVPYYSYLVSFRDPSFGDVTIENQYVFPEVNAQFSTTGKTRFFAGGGAGYGGLVSGEGGVSGITLNAFAGLRLSVGGHTGLRIETLIRGVGPENQRTIDLVLGIERWK